MARYRSRLPPLDRLVFFEAVLRLGSFTRAAGELSVSQAAVSKQIRQLEDWLGAALFERGPHRLVPTEAARRLGDRVKIALDFLDEAIAGARVPGEPVVQVAAMNAVGMFWLQPKLRAFGLSDAACAFNLRLTDDPAALFSEDNDLAIVYGDGDFSGWTSARLFEETLVPIAHPSVAAALSQLKVLASADTPLLDYERRAPDWVDWAGWARRVDRRLPDDAPRRLCSSYAQSVGRALAGGGVALGSLPLISEELAAGRLVTFGQPACATARGYWCAWPNGRRLSQEAKNLANALTDSDLPAG